MRIILNENFKMRYNELGNKFTLAFFFNSFFELILFIILFFVFGVVFYKSLRSYPDLIKTLFIIFSLIIIIFDMIFFAKIDAKQLKDIKSNIPLFFFPTIPIFNNKKINFISNPMSSGYYWSFLIIFLIIIFLLFKE